MGLFDNLFLDQNTPITINDGVDHSKDVVVPIIDTSGKVAGSSGAGSKKGSNPKDEAKKDDSIEDLFESDKKEEKDALKTLHPDEPVDIALEIGKTEDISLAANGSIPPADPALSGVSFDIGGDLSFSNISETSIETNKENSGASEVEMTDSNVVPPEITTEKIEPPVVPNPEVSEASALPIPEIAGIFHAPTEPNAPEAGTKNPDETPVVVDAPAGNTPQDGNIFDLISGLGDPSAEAVAGTTPPSPTESIRTSVPDIVPTYEITPTPVVDTTQSLGSGGVITENSGAQSLSNLIPSIGSTTSVNNLERDALALFTRGGQNSSQLRDKLSSFIEELKILHSHDQSQRNHKLEQIAMYEERIREIDIEAANRKRVLHAEIEDLRRQIELMDTEKNDIQDVIASFHKELHVN